MSMPPPGPGQTADSRHTTGPQPTTDLQLTTDSRLTTDSQLTTDSRLTTEVSEWLFREAELLDDGFERKWLEEMVSRDIVYQVPLRQTVERARGAGWVEGTYHLDERYGSLETRVARNETAYAWAEDPPSRIRHFVSNVRARQRPDGLIAVRSNLLIYRTRQDNVVPQMLSGERHDTLRPEVREGDRGREGDPGGEREGRVLRLLERRVLLDLTAIGTHNLSIFF